MVVILALPKLEAKHSLNFEIMKYIIVLLILTSCSFSRKAIECESSIDIRYSIEPRGVVPIESFEEDDVLRIWIDRSSSITQILTIVKDSSESYCEFIEVGYKFRRKKLIPYFKKKEICPVNGWDDFYIKLEGLKPAKITSRKHNPASDALILGHSISKYFVELKNEKSINRFEFYSQYPSNNFPSNMKQYCEFEKLMLTSFNPLIEQLKKSQENHHYLGPFDY